jgi:ABC-type multidrug transport system fused ATPase/permease subunit
MTAGQYTKRFVREVISTAPARSVFVIAMLASSSFFEGIALAMLFPLLAMVGFSGAGELNDIAVRISNFIGQWGIAANIYVIAALLVLTTVFQHLLFSAQAWIAAGLQSEFTVRWRQALTNALLRSEWLYFTRNKTGELSHVVNVETNRAAHLITYGCQVLSLGLTALVYFLVALLASWKVTLILMLGGAAIVALGQLLVRHPARLSARQSEFYARYSGKSSEIMGGMKLVRASGGDAAVRRVLWPLIEELRKVDRKIIMSPVILRASFEISSVVALMGALVVAIRILGSDGATVLLIAALFMRLYPRISTIQQYVHQFRVSIPQYAAVVDALDAAEAAAEIQVAPAGLERKLVPPNLILRDVCVSYDDRPALHSVTLKIPARNIVAVVGPSGAGKSTLVDALLRLVPISSGKIMVDGADLQAMDVVSWRRSVGYVPQDTFLFNATIAENISFGQSDAAIDDIREAARKAQISNFIETLPLGYNTIVGDRGVLLSGGQRQRVGLARALLGGKGVLILDEATSALDSETEAAIMRDIESLRRQITIVVIAHRLSTVRGADKIVVLDAGHVVEQGSPQELMRADGVYARLVNMQFLDLNVSDGKQSALSGLTD